MDPSLESGRLGTMPLYEIRLMGGETKEFEGAPITGRLNPPVVGWQILPGEFCFQVLHSFRGADFLKRRRWLPAAASPRPSWGSALCSLGARDPGWGGVITVWQHRPVFSQCLGHRPGGRSRCTHSTWWRKGDCSPEPRIFATVSLLGRTTTLLLGCYKLVLNFIFLLIQTLCDQTSLIPTLELLQLSTAV